MFPRSVIILLLVLCNPLAMAKNQTTDTILMVSPDSFMFNAKTSDTNTFAKPKVFKENKAQSEFAIMVKQIKANGIEVIILPSKKNVITPDAVFPNNWFSVHKQEDGTRLLALYPMLTKNRQLEKQIDVLTSLIKPDKVLNFSFYEKQGHALEGTGSMVLDRKNKIAYISLSSRAHKLLAEEICKNLTYFPIFFESFDRNSNKIYHTNVMMSIGKNFSVVCLECIHDQNQRIHVKETLQKHGREVIAINKYQLHNMAGNILELKNKNNEPKIIMSRSAYDVFNKQQKLKLTTFGDLVVVNIPTIESIGGGSARCMMAEIF